MAIRSGRVTGVASVLAALLLIALPVSAAHTPEHTIEEIWAVIDEASQAMTTVVDDFELAITTIGDPDEVDAAESAASAEVTAIWTAARNEIDDLAKLHPGTGQEVTAARQQLQQVRNTCRAEITALANAWVPPVPSTTTTTTVPPTTTTTTAPTTTTTTHGNSGNTPGGGGSGNGNGNGQGGGNGGGNGGGTSDSGTATGNPSNAGSGTTGGQSQTNSTPRNKPDVVVSQDQGVVAKTFDVQDSIEAMGLGFVPETSAIALVAETPQISGDLGGEEAVITTQVSTLLETVLPPAVVNAVLSPLLVVEILTKTIMADGQKVLLPVALLALCALLIALGDRIESRSSRLLAYFRK